MNILIIYPFLLHAQVRHGSGIYTLRLLQALDHLRHKIYLLSLAEMDPQPYQESIQELHQWCKEISIFPHSDQSFLHKASSYLTSGIPPHINRLTLPLAVDYVLKLINSENIDIVYGIFTTSGEYLKAVNRKKCKTILDVVELETRRLEMRLKSDRFPYPWGRSFLSYQLKRVYEKNLLKSVDRVIAISAEEKEYIQRLSADCDVSVLRPIVDTARTIDDDEIKVQDSILFLGSFHHQPNIEAVNWFLQHVMPRIIEKAPTAHLYIVGSQAEQLKLGSCEPSVTNVGEVEDVQEWLRKCIVFVSPIRSGGGARMKNLEALSAGCPLVTTSLGAEGLVAPAGSAYLVADEPLEFAECVIRLIGDAELRKRMGREGRHLVEKGHDIHVVGEQLNRLLETTLNG